MDKSKPLHAVAIERITVKSGKVVVNPEIEYLHATDVNEARILYTAGNPDRKKTRIVGIARVIGYHAEDDNGDVVSA